AWLAPASRAVRQERRQLRRSGGSCEAVAQQAIAAFAAPTKVGGGRRLSSALVRLQRRESRQLFRRYVTLVPVLPLREGFPVDRLARLLLRQLDAVFGGGLAVPVGQAVAAEAGADHQVDVLHVRPLVHQVPQQAPEGGRLDRGGVGRGVVSGHGVRVEAGESATIPLRRTQITPA